MKEEKSQKKPLWIDPKMHTQIKTSASAENLSIKEFIGKMYGLYINQTAHQ